MAQLDLFQQTYLDVLLKTSHFEAGRKLSEMRVKQRPLTPRGMWQLSQSLEGTGRAHHAKIINDHAGQLNDWYSSHPPEKNHRASPESFPKLDIRLLV